MVRKPSRLHSVNNYEARAAYFVNKFDSKSAEEEIRNIIGDPFLAMRNNTIDWPDRFNFYMSMSRQFEHEKFMLNQILKGLLVQRVYT